MENAIRRLREELVSIEMQRQQLEAKGTPVRPLRAFNTLEPIKENISSQPCSDQVFGALDALHRDHGLPEGSPVAYREMTHLTSPVL